MGSPFAFVTSYCSSSERSDELSRVLGMFAIELSSVLQLMLISVGTTRTLVDTDLR